MVVDKEEGGNKECPHMLLGIEVFHTSVVVGLWTMVCGGTY